MQFPRCPHRWSVTPRRARAIQAALASRVVTRGEVEPVRLVAGMDLAFAPGGEQCVAGVVVWDVVAQRVVEERLARRPVRFPYVPGLLSFREAPALLAALRKVRSEPDALMLDGQGYAHPRRFGLACHVGVLTGRPTVGCAKSRLIGTHAEPGRRRGERATLFDAGEVVGQVLRTRDSVKPVFVSVGHRVSLETAVAIVLACGGGYRVPEPTRRADQLVTAARNGVMLAMV